MKIFLDDTREPEDYAHYMHKRIGTLNPLYLEEWVVVRNYKDFVKVISENALNITHVSFDHDLGEDEARDLHLKGMSKRKARQSKKQVKSGYDCAKWLKEFFKEKNLKLPYLFCHSMNPVGTENIINLFK